MIFSKLTFQTLVLAALLLAASEWLPVMKPLAYVIDLILLLAVAIDYQLTLRPNLITATREVTERLSIGRANSVTIRISNAGANAVSCLVRDDYPEYLPADVREFAFQLPASGFSQLDYTLTPTRRGVYQFGHVNIRYLSYLGLFWRQSKIDLKKKVKVYSDLRALHDLSIKLSRSSELGELHQRKRGQGTDFASLREYTVGDDAKSIDWKATARRDRPVVRTYEAEKEQRLLILIDAGRMMTSDLQGLTRFDHALNAALCLALTGLSHNDQVGFGIFADKPLAYLPPHRGKNYMKKILEVSFDIEPRMIEPDYVGVLSYFASAQKGRCLMVVLTDLTDATGSQALLAGLASLSPRHLPFCVTLKDRQVAEIANISPNKGSSPEQALTNSESLDILYKRAIATDLLAQRELALSVLARRGCLILDCPPQELSDKLVDAYLDIKARARL
jgi:uncharacterized protein (DUF58 family)